MKRNLCLLVLLFMLLPLFVTAEEKAENDTVLKTQEMIDSRDFLQKGGVEKMQLFTTNLTDDSKASLYRQYKKNPVWGWTSILVPSLGNWIEGDKLDGVLSLVGFAGGFGIALAGNFQRDGATTTTTRTSTSYSTTVSGGTVNSTGIAMYVIGGVIMLASDVFSVTSAVSYADRYNRNLKSGLSIAYVDATPMNFYALNSQASTELFHLNLISYNF